MDIEQIRQIVAQAGKWAAGIFGGLGGVAGIVSIIRCIITAKKSKLTAADKNEIAEKAAQKIADKQAISIDVDMSAEIDKATKKRIAELEDAQNINTRQYKRLSKWFKLIMASISEFRTLSNDNRVALIAAVAEKDEDVEIPEIETPKIIAKIAKKEDAEIVKEVY